MKKLKILLVPVMAVFLLAGSVNAAKIELRYDRLTDALNLLSGQDRETVEDAIRLIKEGQHTLALARIAALKQDHPENSSLRILASYVLLETGNLLGAFDEAQKAEKSPNGNSYKCWFLAKVALLNGDKTVCKQELNHVKKAGDMVAEANALEKEMKKD